jgi:hypothetical protein
MDGSSELVAIGLLQVTIKAMFMVSCIKFGDVNVVDLAFNEASLLSFDTRA